MRRIAGKYYKRVLALILTVQAICLCCISSACSTAQAQSSIEPVVLDIEELSGDNSSLESYSRWLNTKYSSNIYNRADWLRSVMLALGVDVSSIGTEDYQTLFRTAYGQGLITDAIARPYPALTRAYAASTIVRALSYEQHDVDDITDADKGSDLMTLVYYGYFLPDDDGRIYPDAVVTAEEYSALLTQIQRYVRLKGKRLLAFGDSIMRGMANFDCGICELIAEKYGMSFKNYAVSGATFGTEEEHSHIPDQIKESNTNGDEADIILIDGGTNDMRMLPLGRIASGYQLDKKAESTFCGGMEYSLALIKRFWPDVPVVYIRAHDMDCCDDVTEQLFGRYALAIARKWSADVVDIYEDTSFDTEVEELSYRYTGCPPKTKKGDSVHPTALGYAKFYLPLIGNKVDEILS